MPTVKIDERGRLLVERIIGGRMKVDTPVFGRPIHVPLKKLKKTSLEKIEEEMWSS